MLVKIFNDRLCSYSKAEEVCGLTLSWLLLPLEAHGIQEQSLANDLMQFLHIRSVILSNFFR